ncbi:hypothetical protein NLG97_g7705 [Lecanicillium saksenae]|uniref:Uncharacterized protein n=1 Tax=Lecanicillium saksenae TaxID=468837 RepID=A0ACC1QMQ8_9HYPO|nr:hypothetical protein NLG97_g7705 [Lecanicillium saksenae]
MGGATQKTEHGRRAGEKRSSQRWQSGGGGDGDFLGLAGSSPVNNGGARPFPFVAATQGQAATGADGDVSGRMEKGWTAQGVAMVAGNASRWDVDVERNKYDP